MADQNDPKTTNTGDKTQQHGGLAPGESNARAVRGEGQTEGRSTHREGGRVAATGTGTAGTGTGGKQTSGTESANRSSATSGEGDTGETVRVRMTRDEGDHRQGQEVDLPKAEADRLVNGGAAQTV